MQVVSCGKSGFAGFADYLAFIQYITNFYFDGTQMTVQRKQPKSVIYDDCFTINSKRSGKCNFA